ncbi:MAG: protease modulator HflC [Candidatus Eutrophobiaceae bacterium]
MNKISPQTVIIAIVVLLGVLSFSLFRVEQWQQGVTFRFREINRVDIEPGLHLLIPVIDQVQKFENRLLTLDLEPQRYLTKEKKDVIVDYFVKWRITDTTKFYEATRGNVSNANNLLGQRINRALRDEFGKRTVQQVVSGERTEVLDLVTEKTKSLQQDLGLSVVDVRTKRIDLPEEVSSNVYQRMRSERNRVAKELRAEGSEAAERISATADREREIILAEAYRDAEMVRGEGDARATEIYAYAYEKDRDFYAFYRSLSAYKSSFGGNDVLLIEPNSEFFRFFEAQSGKK